MRDIVKLRKDSPQILIHALGMSLTEVYHLKHLTPEQSVKVDIAEWAIHLGIPLARVFGNKFFWKDTFYISPFTLEPRPETEYLVEFVSQKLKPKKILDIGTGTGCILLSLLREFPYAQGFGVDISKYAIQTAIKNADHLGLSGAANFICDDFVNITGTFDLIIANPPYIKTECDLSALFDPPVALWDNDSYRRIFELACTNLAPRGSIVLEVPEYQVNDLSTLAHTYKLQLKLFNISSYINLLHLYIFY